MQIIALAIALLAIIVIVAAPWQHRPLKIAGMPLLIGAGALQIPMLLDHRIAYAPAVGAGLVVIWAVANRQLPGARLLMFGAGLNVLAMLHSQGMMPLAPHMVASLPHLGAPSLLAHSKDVIGTADVWQWIGDWMPLQLPSLTLVGSPGDLLIAAAVIYWACISRRLAIRQTALIRTA